MLSDAIHAYPALFAVVWAWVGACAGSFMNVCIWRIPNDMSILSPPSHCPKCGHNIPFYENIPVLSWLMLHGRCSACKEPISIRYFLVELLTALLFLAVWLKVIPLRPDGDDLLILLSYSVTVFAVTASAFTDCDYRIIPDGFVLTLLIPVGAIQAVLTPDWMQFGISLAGAAAIFLLLSGLAVLGRNLFGRTALGWGDVKLLSALTLFCGPLLCLVILLFASLLTIFSAPLYRKLKPKMRHRALPFAPFIAVVSGVILLTPLHDLILEIFKRNQ